MSIICGIPCKEYSQPLSVSLRNCCDPILSPFIAIVDDIPRGGGALVQLKSLWCQYYDSTDDSSINANNRISSVSSLLQDHV